MYKVNSLKEIKTLIDAIKYDLVEMKREIRYFDFSYGYEKTIKNINKIKELYNNIPEGDSSIFDKFDENLRLSKGVFELFMSTKGDNSTIYNSFRNIIKELIFNVVEIEIFYGCFYSVLDMKY